MRRRISLLLALLGCCAVVGVQPAYAQEPTIVTSIIFPEEGEPFGTFTAAAPLCPSGTFADQQVGGGGAFKSGHVFYHSFTVLKTLTCSDGSGTFTILFHPQFSPATPEGCEEAGPFAVISGTGDYENLRGTGEFCVFPSGEGFQETFTGTFRLP
jgi:hypothetical protein